MRAALALLLSVILSACATPVPMESIKYSRTASVKSELPITVRVAKTWTRERTVSWVPAGGVVVPVSSDLSEHLQFSAEQQLQFGRLLQNELVRLQISKELSASSSEPELFADVSFLKAVRNPLPQSLRLQVRLSLGRAGQVPLFTSDYDIDSLDGLTGMQQMSIDGEETKARGVSLLLDRLLDDIQEQLKKLR